MEQEAIPCILKTDVYNMGHLASDGSLDLHAGTKIDLPLWTARSLKVTAPSRALWQRYQISMTLCILSPFANFNFHPTIAVNEIEKMEY